VVAQQQQEEEEEEGEGEEEEGLSPGTNHRLKVSVCEI